MPGLATPFALVAASATFFSTFALGLAGPSMREGSPIWPALFAILPGALSGTLLRRWRYLYHPFTNGSERVGRIALVVVVTGALVGAILGLSSWDEAWPCTKGGAAFALAFIPTAASVHAAAMRAARGRLGSIVADVDRRTVLATLLAVVAFAAMTQAPALAFAAYSVRVNHLVQSALSFGVGTACAVAIAVLRRRDLQARAQLEVAAAQPCLEPADARATPDSVAALDLGLGEDRWSRATHLATYRTFDRAEVVLRGSIDEARRAIDSALVQRRRALIFSIVTIAVTQAAFAIGALGVVTGTP